MANEKMIILANKVYAKTKEGKIDWKESPFEDGYYSNIAKAQVHVKANETYNSIDIRNSSGNIIDEIRTDDRGLTYEDATIIVELLDLARRKALGADETIDAVLDELDDNIPF